MLCEKCGKRNATVLYTQIVNGKKHSLHICSQCAEGESLFDNFGSLLSFGTRAEAGSTVCPCCGMTLAEFTHKGRMGCGKCYETFRNQAKSMLRKIHGTSTHKAQNEATQAEAMPENPKKRAPEKKRIELEILREELMQAINEENYEQAAVLRDKIREKEGN